MKQIIFSLIALSAFCLTLKAQKTTNNVKIFLNSSEYIVTPDSLKKSGDKDTILVRGWRKEFVVPHPEGKTEIFWEKVEQDSNRTDTIWGFSKQNIKNHRKRKVTEVNPNQFYGHWQAFELGINGFDNENYSKYGVKDFMSLDQGNSQEFNCNFYVVNIGLQQIKNNIGLVSGMGVSFNDYRFENPYTLAKGTEMTEPVLLEYDNLQKSKLSIVYLNVPLLLEFQTPFKNGYQKFISLGLITGVKLDSHTKVKHGDNKDKDHSGFNLNPFKCSATARVGFKSWNLYGNYSLTSLFKSGKGPELTPFSVGVILFWDRDSSTGSLGLNL